jgi:hypothetical protein
MGANHPQSASVPVSAHTLRPKWEPLSGKTKKTPRKLRSERGPLKRVSSNGPVIASPQRSEGRSNPETIPGLLRRFAPRNDESVGSIPAEPAIPDRELSVPGGSCSTTPHLPHYPAPGITQSTARICANLGTDRQRWGSKTCTRIHAGAGICGYD